MFGRRTVVDDKELQVAPRLLQDRPHRDVEALVGAVRHHDDRDQRPVVDIAGRAGGEPVERD